MNLQAVRNAPWFLDKVPLGIPGVMVENQAPLSMDFPARILEWGATAFSAPTGLAFPARRESHLPQGQDA